MSAIGDQLLEIEQGFWSGDKVYYERHVDQDCLVAFTEMAGVLSNAELAATVKQGNRWRDVEMKTVGLVMPFENVAILTYAASAMRENGERYSALVTSGYAKRNDDWKLMFHAQTPREIADSQG